MTCHQLERCAPCICALWYHTGVAVACWLAPSHDTRQARPTHCDAALHHQSLASYRINVVRTAGERQSGSSAGPSVRRRKRHQSRFDSAFIQTQKPCRSRHLQFFWPEELKGSCCNDSLKLLLGNGGRDGRYFGAQTTCLHARNRLTAQQIDSAASFKSVTVSDTETCFTRYEQNQEQDLKLLTGCRRGVSARG